MEAPSFCSKTLTADEPPPSEPSDSRLSLFSPSAAASLSGSSSVSPVVPDSGDDIGILLERIREQETLANPCLSESPSPDNGFLSTSAPSSLSSIEHEPSQPLAFVSYVPKNSLDSKEQEKEKDPHGMSFSQRDTAFDLYSGRENPFKAFEYRYDPWRWLPSPSSSPRGAFMPEIERTGVGAGLKNLGNTCFMNAVLQCFTHTVPLVLGLRSLSHGQPCARNIESFCLLCALYDHIELSLNSSGGVLSPSNIFDNLNHISSCFQRYHQEDAHEFLQCLLDRLESCCSNSKSKNDCSSSPDDCLVKKVFGGRLVSSLFCCNCGHISYTYEPMNDLSLEIGDVDTLPSALESFTKVEKIEDQEAKFKCENCKEEVSVEKQLMLDQAPSVATFHLKRFKTEGAYVQKIDKHVAFPLELNLQPYTIVDHRSDEELKYQLYAVVKHSGLTPTSGHYVCYIRSSTDTWHELNDSKVTKVEEEAVLSQIAYILFYARQDIPWFSTAIEVVKPCPGLGISETSPKSVLHNIELDCPSDPLVKCSADCGANECKDVADRTSTQSSFQIQKDKGDEPCVASKEISSGWLDNESEPDVPKFTDSGNDNLMTDDSMPPLSSSSDRNISSILSHVGENNSTQGTDGDINDGCLARMQARSQCSDKLERDSSDCVPLAQLKEKRGISRKAVKRSARDLERNEALRYIKRRVHSSRGAKCLAVYVAEGSSNSELKKRTGSSSSSPCKRVSPRRRHNHSLMHPVPVSR